MTIALRSAVVGVIEAESGAAAVAAARAFGATDILLVAVDPHADAPSAEALLSAVRERVGGDVATLVARDRVPGRALVAAARDHDADVLVLGPPGSSGLHLLHGETGRTALDRASCPVLVLRDTTAAAAEPPRTIAVGFDGSPSSRAAVAVADALAQEAAAALTVLTAWTTAVTPFGGPLPEEGAAVAARCARELLDALLEELPPRTAGVLVHGGAGAELRAISEKVDLLVVGTGDHRTARRILVGSTADQVAHAAACPVLMVPGPDAGVTGDDDAAAATAGAEA